MVSTSIGWPGACPAAVTGKHIAGRLPIELMGHLSLIFRKSYYFAKMH
jgi:hypothetical protein